MKTLDRTPLLTRESSPHRRRKSGRAKPFKIEMRYIGPHSHPEPTFFSREWRLLGSYETERACESALQSLRNKGGYWKNFEYRQRSEA